MSIVTEQPAAGRARALVFRFAPEICGLLLLTTFGTVALLSVRDKSLTIDEPTHYAFGARMLTHGHQTQVTLSAMAINQINAAANFYLRSDRSMVPQTPAAVLFARIPTVLAAVLLGALVFAFARNLYGGWAGVLSLAVYCLSPTLLAHSRWVTNDVFSTLFMLATLYLLWRYLKRGGLWYLLGSAACCGIAQVSKFTSILIFPIAAILWAVYRWPELKESLSQTFKCGARPGQDPATGATGGPDGPGGPRPRTWPGRCARLAVFVAVCWFVWNGAYYFQGTFSRWRSQRFSSTFMTRVARVLGPLPTGLPNPYLLALDVTFYINEVHAGRGYIHVLGRTSKEGFWYYFPVALLFKVPLPVWGLLFLAGWLGLRRKTPPLKPDELTLALPAAVLLFYFIFLCTAQIGVRYLTPVLVLVHIFLGRIAGGRRDDRGRGAAPPTRPRAVLWTTAALLSWQAVSVFSYYPHFLSYFNELVPNRKHAYRILSDSNLDWGQNHFYVKTYLEKHSMTWRQVNPRWPAAGRIVVSASRLTGVGHPLEYRWLRRLEPIGHVAYSHLVFDISYDQLKKALGVKGGSMVRPRPVSYGLRAGLYTESFPNTDLKGRPCQRGRSWPSSRAKACDRADNFSLRMRGYLRIPQSADYLISLGSDDGSRLYMGGRKVLDLWSDHGLVFDSVLVGLARGDYPLTIEFYERTGAALLQFRVQNLRTGAVLDQRRVFWHDPGERGGTVIR